MQARLRHLADRVQARQVGPPGDVDQHAAAGVVRRRHDGDRLRRAVDAQLEQAGVDHREVVDDELRAEVRHVEPDVAEAEPLDLGVDRAGDDVARRELHPLVVARHEARAVRQQQVPALAAHRLGDEEVLDLAGGTGRSGGTG